MFPKTIEVISLVSIWIPCVLTLSVEVDISHVLSGYSQDFCVKYVVNKIDGQIKLFQSQHEIDKKEESSNIDNTYLRILNSLNTSIHDLINEFPYCETRFVLDTVIKHLVDIKRFYEGHLDKKKDENKLSSVDYLLSDFTKSSEIPIWLSYRGVIHAIFDFMDDIKIFRSSVDFIANKERFMEVMNFYSDELNSLRQNLEQTYDDADQHKTQHIVMNRFNYLMKTLNCRIR